MDPLERTPAALGYKMPAEWEPHEATWLAWPHERSDWPGKFAPIPWVYGEIVRHLSRVERVRILVQNADAEQRARRVLKKSGARMEALEFFQIATNRSWTRDYCPMFVRNGAGELGMLNWRFNAWAKYENYAHDDAVTAQLAQQLGYRMWTPHCNGRRVVLEGGSIDVNGAGAILTTEECLLSDIQARNPGLSRQDLEQIFRDYLGAPRTIWLHNGIAGDDTHGHIDDVARFTDEYTIAIASEGDASPLRDTGLRIETLPLPEPVYFNGQRLPASYANFYIANGLVLVPTFNDKNDRIALDKLAALFPDREVVGIASTDLVLGLGTLHCMTQQEPA
jgi:agmatine deiminase